VFTDPVFSALPDLTLSHDPNSVWHVTSIGPPALEGLDMQYNRLGMEDVYQASHVGMTNQPFSNRR
jgi:hypothetical protein